MGWAERANPESRWNKPVQMPKITKRRSFLALNFNLDQGRQIWRPPTKTKRRKR